YKFGFVKTGLSKTVPLNFSVGAAGSLLHASGDANFQLTMDASASVDLVFRTTGGGSLLDRTFLGADSKLRINVTADAGYDLGGGTAPPPLESFTLTVGGLPAFTVTDGRALVRFTLDASIAGSADVPLSQFGPANVTAVLSGDAQAVLPLGGGAQVEIAG